MVFAAERRLVVVLRRFAMLRSLAELVILKGYLVGRASPWAGPPGLVGVAKQATR